MSNSFITSDEIAALRKEIAPLRKFNRDGFRYCQFCACHTNAHALACCDAGRTHDAALNRLIGTLPKLLHALEEKQNPGPICTFEETWAEMEAQGYRYGQDGLEQVRFGWELRGPNEKSLIRERNLLIDDFASSYMRLERERDIINNEVIALRKICTETANTLLERMKSANKNE